MWGRVYFLCSKCTAQGVVHLHGNYDIKDVKHTCKKNGGDGAFHFEYDPPRRAF